MRRLRTFLLIGLGAAVACGGNSPSPPTPTGPSTTPGTLAQSPTGTGIAAVTSFTFTASNFIANTGGTLTYTWDFGDGTAGLDPGAVVTHTYQTPGTFVVKLSVGNSKDSSAVSALISGLQVVSLSGSWGVHDSTGALVVNRGMSFSQSGTTLRGDITSVAGCLVAISGIIVPPRMLNLSFTLPPSNGCQPFPIPLPSSFSGTADDGVSVFSGNLNSIGGVTMSRCANGSVVNCS